jgi:hypothetical protein
MYAFPRICSCLSFPGFPFLAIFPSSLSSFTFSRFFPSSFPAFQSCLHFLLSNPAFTFCFPILPSLPAFQSCLHFLLSLSGCPSLLPLHVYPFLPTLSAFLFLPTLFRFIFPACPMLVIGDTAAHVNPTPNNICVPPPPPQYLASLNQLPAPQIHHSPHLEGLRWGDTPEE